MPEPAAEIRTRAPFPYLGPDLDLKQAARALTACGIAYVALIALFIVLLVLTFLLTSDAKIQSRLLEAIDKGVLTTSDYPVSPFGHTGHQNDMFSECVALGLNSSNPDRSVLYRVVADEVSLTRPCATLVAAVKGGTGMGQYAYFRFWHGYEVYLRPALSLMSLSYVRRLNAIMLFGAFAFFCFQCAKLFGPLAWPVLLVPFAFVGDLLTMPAITVHSLPMTWIFLSAAGVAVMLERWDKTKALILPVAVFVSGAVANFIGYLFNPALAPALIAFLVLAAHRKGYGSQSVMGASLCALSMVLIWFLGYFLTWMAKWALAVLVLGYGAVIADVMSASSGTHYAKIGMSQAFHIFQSSWFVVSEGTRHLPAFIGLSWALSAAMLGWGLATRRLNRSDIIYFAILQAPLSIPVIWAELMRAHSVEHSGFAYRSFLVLAIFPLLAALLLLRKGPEVVDRSSTALEAART